MKWSTLLAVLVLSMCAGIGFAAGMYALVGFYALIDMLKALAGNI